MPRHYVFIADYAIDVIDWYYHEYAYQYSHFTLRHTASAIAFARYIRAIALIATLLPFRSFIDTFSPLYCHYATRHYTCWLLMIRLRYWWAGQYCHYATHIGQLAVTMSLRHCITDWLLLPLMSPQSLPILAIDIADFFATHFVITRFQSLAIAGHYDTSQMILPLLPQYWLSRHTPAERLLRCIGRLLPRPLIQPHIYRLLIFAISQLARLIIDVIDIFASW